MGRKPADFEAVKERVGEQVERFIVSLGGAALLSDVTAFCRMRGWTGLARAVLSWLESEGRVTVDRETKMVFVKEAGE